MEFISKTVHRICINVNIKTSDNIFIALIFRHTIFKRIIKMVLLTDWQTLLIGMKTASTWNTVLRYVCTVCLFTLYLLQFPRNPWLFYKMLKIILSLTFLQWIPNCTNTSQKWASYRLNKYPYYFVDVNIDRIDTVPKMFCFPTWMVTARWVHSEQTLNTCWTKIGEGLWTVSECRAQTECKYEHKLNGECTMNAMWMQDEWFIWSASGVIFSTLFFFSNEEKFENNNKLTTYMYCYQPK